MDRPFPIDAAALADPAAHSLIDSRRVAAMLGTALVAALLGAALGHGFGFALGALTDSTRDHAAQFAHALAYLLGALAALTVMLRQLAFAVLRDRVRGCAWVGAPDPVISHAFLFGGVMAVVDTLLLAAPTTEQGDWRMEPAMLLAFAAITVVPVLEELLLRGLLFAMLRERITVAVAAITAAVASAPLHLLGVVPHVGSAPGAIAIGACAMLLRLRHASLAPAIAVNCGAAFIRCVLAALG